MINLVVQVCNRLARRACDEYYETKRTMREKKTIDSEVDDFGTATTRTVRQDMSIYSAIRKKSKGTNKKGGKDLRVTDSEWEMMGMHAKHKNKARHSGYQPA